MNCGRSLGFPFLFSGFQRYCWTSRYTPTIGDIIGSLLASSMVRAGCTYRLDRLKPRASQFRGPPVKVFHVFKNVIGLSHLCCHSVLNFLNNPSVIFLTQLHSISEYCRILNTPHHLCLYWNWLNTLQSPCSREAGVLGGASQVD